MRDSDFLRRQAERCIAISRATIDLTIAGRLRTMAADFRAKAAEWDGDEMDGCDRGQSEGNNALKPRLPRD